VSSVGLSPVQLCFGTAEATVVLISFLHELTIIVDLKKQHDLGEALLIGLHINGESRV
jgi:hypothetical protein